MSTTAADRSSGGFVVALWAAILLVVFTAFRSTDLLSLPSLLSGLGGGPLFGPEAVDSIVGVLAAGLLFLAWFGLGSLLNLFLRGERRPTDSHILEIAGTTAAGSAIWSIVWFFLGVAGFFDLVTAIGTAVVGVGLCVLGVMRLRAAKEESRTPEPASSSDRFFLILIAIALLIAFVAALAPPIAKDTLLYHFALPKAYIAQHSNAFVEGNIASYLALGGEMQFVWAMLLGGLYSLRAGETAAGAVAFLYLPLLLAAIFGWARELNVSRSWSLIAVLVVACIPTVFHSASSGYTDVALALYATLAVYSIFRWLETRETRTLIFFAIFIGGALAIKLTTLFLAAALALVLLLSVRQEAAAAKLTGTAILAIVLGGVLASPWYLRTWAATGSPLFPFYLSVWKGEAPGWDVERSNLFQLMNSQYGGVDRAPINYLTAPFRLSLAAQPEDANLYDGVLGAAFLIGLPLIIIAVRRKDDPAIGALAAVAGIYFLFWLFSSEQIRYLLPIVPLLAIAIAAAGNRTPQRSTERAWYYAFAAASVLGLATSLAWFAMRSPVRVVLGGETRDAYLARQLDHYPYYQMVNTGLAKKVWLINMRRDTYYLDRPYVSDYLFEDWTFRKFLWESKNLDDLRRKAEALGVDRVLARHDFLFDYDKTTLVDDKKSRAENLEKLAIAKEFLLHEHNCEDEKADAKFSLVRVDIHGCGNGSGTGDRFR